MSHSKVSASHRAWKKSAQIVNDLGDGLGRAIDEGIKRIVTALLVYKFPTTGSCEGHSDHGFSYPWVDVAAPHPEEWKQSEKRKDLARRVRLKHQRRLLDLLEEFYARRHAPFDVRLTLDQQGFGSFRLQSMGAHVVELYGVQERRRKLFRFQKEMNHFATFLQRRSPSHN